MRWRSALGPDVGRWIALTLWGDLVWTLLTWTLTAEQVLVGVVVAGGAAAVLSPLGPVVRPWAVLRPSRLAALIRLALTTVAGIVRANLTLTSRVWLPSRPLRSGMVIVPTVARTDGSLAVVGLISSLIVDNQIVDLDRTAHQLQYHAISVPPGDPDQVRRRVNEPVERFLPGVMGGAP